MNIAVFLDGTWSDPLTNTNVVQLKERAEPADAEGARQEVIYRPGVGTKRAEHLRGGLFGHGLNTQIEESYAELARAYTGAEDRFFLFGFSRGAFSARSLAGMIARCGIIRDEHLSAEKVFARYRRGQGSPGLNEMQRGEAQPRDDEDRLVLERSTLARIRFIGVFDTVGSLGIPGGLFRPLVAGRYAFHDTKLSGLVDHARHAVAVEQQRPPLRRPSGTASRSRLKDTRRRWCSAGSRGVTATSAPEAPASPRRRTRSQRSRESGCATRRGTLASRYARTPTQTAWRGPISDSYASFGKGWFYKVVRWRKRLYRPIDTTVNGQEFALSVVQRYREIPDYRPRKNPGFDDAFARASAPS